MVTKQRYDQISSTLVTELDTTKASLGHVIRKGKGINGKDALFVTIFVPSISEHGVQLDMSFLLAVPNLTEPLLEAFIQWAGDKTPKSMGSIKNELKLGIVAFLVEMNMREISISKITN